MRTLLLLAFSVLFTGVYAQTVKLSGKVTDSETGLPMPFAGVVIKETGKGSTTDDKGFYTLNLDYSGGKTSYTLTFSFIGYKEEVRVVSKSDTRLDVSLSPNAIMGKEVVISGSRVSESLMESPVSIQKMNAQQLNSTSGGNFYDGFKNIRGVDISTSSAGFQAVNMRGFNTTAPVRVVQFVDGMDNQAPGLNFPVGNLVGGNPLDLESVEVITGPASALYGPNAFQGVVNMISKNPYDYQGIDAEIKGGSRNWIEGNFRYAQAFGAKQKFAVKLTGSYMQMNDWIADSEEANRYGDISADVNLSSIVSSLQYDSSLTQEDRDQWVALNNYIEFNPVVGQVGLNKKPVNAPGYMENQLADNRVRSIKAGLGLHYRFTPQTELSYTGKFGLGSAIYQGANRYAIRDILFHQHKLELKGKNYLVKAYGTFEDAGKSYDAVFTGINISKASIGDNWVPTYLRNFFETLGNLNNDYDNDAQPWMVDSAMNVAMALANNSWYQPGTSAYDSTRKSIITNSDLQRGSLFEDRSSLIHLDGQYTFDMVKWLDLQAGANFRYYAPRSFGTIFSDTLVNRGDTLANGAADRNAQFTRIDVWELGGYIQATKKFFNDRFKINASVRVDKNKNFKPQFSPRLSLSFTHKSHNFRVSAQSAFRIPTLQNQYIRLNLGPITLLGNLNGFDNLYTLNSVNAFNDSLAGNYDLNTIDPNILKSVSYDRLKPEQVITVEAGYRGVLWKKLYVDADVYWNRYTNFIGDVRVVRPLGGAIAGEESGFDAIATGNYEVYQIPVNSAKVVNSLGAGIGLSYYIIKGLQANFNYTYAKLLTEDLEEDIIPGFNTAPHKINIGLNGNRLWKGLGFSTAFQWVDGFVWQSPFGDGNIRSYHIWDAQINYAFDFGQNTLTARAGSSNLLNNRRREIFGGPTIGRMFYGSLSFSWDRLKPKKKTQKN
ncbi:MAG: TonB-dependent receptor [Flavobacteriales bacterium]|nr:TonB-dependent receptor [Flavobacteriales bacterium]